MKKTVFVVSAIVLTVMAQAQKPTQKAPPPPPPVVAEVPPPPPPKVSIEKFAPPSELALNAEKEYKAFLKRNPTVKAISWSNRPNRVFIVLKSGKTEVYNLQDGNDVKRLEQKYGALPVAPPPPPPPPVPEVIEG